MDAESFFARWSRRKTQSVENEQAATADADLPIPMPVLVDDPAKLPPTLEDVAMLTAESDFTPFLARGVAENVRRSAMKKLFTDPHFNVMDGLDIYIGDYNTFEPIPAEMLAALNHAQALLNPLAHLENSLMRSVQPPVDTAPEQDKNAELSPQQNQPELPDGAASPEQAAEKSAAIDAMNIPENPTDDNPI